MQIISFILLTIVKLLYLTFNKEHLQLAIIYKRINCCIWQSTLQFAIELPPHLPVFVPVFIYSVFPTLTQMRCPVLT